MRKYGLAALWVGLAWGASIALRPLLSDFPAIAPIFFFWAVALAARYGDFASSLSALLASSVLMDVFFWGPTSRHPVFGVALVKTCFFFLIGLAICSFIRNLREARASRARLAAIVDSSEDAIISRDLSGTVMSWNASATRMFGYSSQEMIGSSILQIIPQELYEQEAAILRSISEGQGTSHFDTERIRKNGTRINVSLTISPVMDSDGRVVGASKIARDITERVKMREAFIESEKLAATGRMAAAIAHEINNPLEALTNLAFLISTNESLDVSGKGCAGMLMHEIDRVSNVAKRSLAFFRDSGKPAEFDAMVTLDAVLDLNRPLLMHKNISVRRDDSQACILFGSAAEIHQVFLNLVRNAIDAIDTGGEIRIRVRPVDHGRCRITIADSGHGIPPEALLRLFEPFVTTKGATGNGLGLWISRGIIEKHQGQIRAKSASIAGKAWTVFWVTLPTASAQKPGTVAATAALETPKVPAAGL